MEEFRTSRYYGDAGIVDEPALFFILRSGQRFHYFLAGEYCHLPCSLTWIALVLRGFSLLIGALYYSHGVMVYFYGAAITLSLLRSLWCIGISLRCVFSECGSSVLLRLGSILSIGALMFQ